MILSSRSLNICNSEIDTRSTVAVLSVFSVLDTCQAASRNLARSASLVRQLTDKSIRKARLRQDDKACAFAQEEAQDPLLGNMYSLTIGPACSLIHHTPQSVSCGIRPDHLLRTSHTGLAAYACFHYYVAAPSSASCVSIQFGLCPLVVWSSRVTLHESVTSNKRF